MKKLFSVLVACVLLGLCAGTSFAAPQIIASSLSPASGATNVDPAVVDTIWAQFDDSKMDKDSFAGRISVDSGASYTVSLVNDPGGDWAKISLKSALKYSTTYTVTIDYRVKNKNGTQMGSSSAYNYSWSFTTKAKPYTDTTPPTVTSTFPASSATDVPLAADVSITFSEVMDPVSITTSSIRVNNGAVSGTVSLDSSGKVATFHPGAGFSSDTPYTVTVSTSVRDSAGNALAMDYTFSFRTLKFDNIAPTVTAASPLSGATNVSVATTISVTFSEAINASTISTSSFTVGGVSGTVSYNPATWVATFTPSAPLANSTTYTVSLGTAIQDLSGNALAGTRTWSFTTEATTPPPSPNEYCQIPPYVTTDGTGIKPNLLLIVDNSGSMYEFAYKAPGTGTSSYDTSYNPASAYFGYFDSGRMYKYSGSYFEPDTAAVNKSSFWSGNFLNWLTMRRVDIIRKVLVGGKALSRSTNTTNYLLAAEDPDRDFYKSYNNVRYTVRAGTSTEVVQDTTNNKSYNVKIYIGDNPPQDGLIQGYRDKINFGLMFFNDGYRYESGVNAVRDGGVIKVDLGTTGTNLITQIESTDPSTWTPLAESLFEAARYFEAADSAYNGGTYSGKDPIAYPCQKNFVMVLTDGESTMDQNIPGSSATASGKVTDTSLDVKSWMDSIAAQEGYASQYASSANGSDGTYYLEGVAYWAHNTDLRSSTLGKNAMPGKQSLTIYTVFAFDDSPIGRDILKKTAKYGGFDDYDGTGRPDKTRKWDKNGDGIPDTYFEAQDGSVLANSLQTAFNDILAKVSSGTAASILSNSEGSGANVLQALFYPKRFFSGQTSADWTGELHNLWYYVDPFINDSTMREDSDYVGGNPAPPHYLNLGSDNVVRFRYNASLDRTTARRYRDAGGDGRADVDSNGDGVADSYTFLDEVDADAVKSIWRAGKLLWQRTTPRTIYTQTVGSLTSFTGLDTSLASTRTLLQAANQTEADKIIAYVAGADQSGYRSRTVNIGGTTGVWRLGDIVASTPRLQSTLKLNAYNVAAPSGYGDTSYGDDRAKAGFIYSSAYANRGMVYVGANDGMLHAFKLGNLSVNSSGDLRATLSGSDLGEEQWAFIPRNALPYLTYYADPAYAHLYYVDGATTINDVSIGTTAGCSNYWDCPKAADGSTWRTVLVGSMGLGGASKMKGAGCKGTACVETPTVDPLDSSKGLGYSSYFALDVTQPDAPSFLWEFGHSGLGFSTAGAALVRISARKADGAPDKSKNGKWFAVLASGPTGPIDPSNHQFKGTSNQNLTLYVLNLVDGTVAAVIDTLVDGSKISNAFAGTITSAVSDTDRWNSNAPGNYQDDALYIGYTQLSGTTWTGGGVLRLVTGEDPDPRNWKLSKVIDGTGPVTSSVVRLQDRKNHNLWLYFGSGRYYYNQDDNNGQRRLYGVKEPCYLAADRLDATCSTGTSLSALTDQSTSISASIGNQGWYINLAPENTAASLGAERLVTDPVALTNGVVYFTTFAPTSDPCGYGGNSYLWGVKFDTGGAASAAALQGRALVQVSTGSFEEVDVASSLTDRGGRKQQNPMVGKPPADPPPIVSKSNLKPVKRILHIKEH
ncbi:Ig-like domain-containing protein [Geomonas anaerohicana]|uniref:Ig-like domain-containing protein n=1 Tax=Geomonas anaerohicana TaxID=2798583 RepID=A0ABS0Y9L6_9BACT|nr:Ig-like domain-containing protein [Geomonas anaerohicana]MBJ6749003.1 Ig-like domain-containing protein [Geomonas anaerohicana]